MHTATVRGFQTLIAFHQPLRGHKYCYLVFKRETNSEDEMLTCMHKLDKCLINIVRCVAFVMS